MTRTRSRQNAYGTRGRSRQSPVRLAALTLAAAGLTTASSGCARPLAPVRFQSRAVAAPAAVGVSAAKSTPTVNAPQQQVLAALAAYTTALGEAEDSMSGAVARESLRPHLAADRVQGLVRAMTAIWAHGESFDGHDIRHVSSVTVVGHHAFVHDCDDTSGMALVDISTGQIVPGSTGRSRANLVTCLDLVAGHWLVQFQLLEDVPCTP
jgi:hypothetical protein